MSERGGGQGNDEFGGFLDEVTRSVTEALEKNTGVEIETAMTVDGGAAWWLSPDRAILDVVDLEARLAEEPA